MRASPDPDRQPPQCQDSDPTERDMETHYPGHPLIHGITLPRGGTKFTRTGATGQPQDRVLKDPPGA